WLFLGKALGGIDNLARRGDDRLRHGNACIRHQADLDAGIAAASANPAPAFAVRIQPNARKQRHGNPDVQPRRVAKVPAEGKLVVHGDMRGAHSLRTAGLSILSSSGLPPRQWFRSLIGCVTMLMFATPDCRSESITVANAPNGTVSSARRNTASPAFFCCFLILSAS